MKALRDRAGRRTSCPALPATGRPRLAELALSVAAPRVRGGFIVWQQVAAPIVIDGQSYPVFDPALWSFWLPWFLVVIALEVVFTVATCIVGSLDLASPWSTRSSPPPRDPRDLAAADGLLLEPGGGRLPWTPPASAAPSSRSATIIAISVA